jgi:hypothetical protein
MGLRFQKRIRIIKGLTINLSKGGASLSAGIRGATVNFSKRGTKTTVGLPGSGLSYSTQYKNSEAKSSQEILAPNPDQAADDSAQASSIYPKLFWIVLLLLVGFLLGAFIK